MTSPCADCRPKWEAWRDAHWSPNRPTNPGGGPLMDGRSLGHFTPHQRTSLLRCQQEELQQQQMDLIAALCAKAHR